MTEKYQQPSRENNFHDRLNEGMLAMMNFEASLLKYHPHQESDFCPEDAIIFGQKVNAATSAFDTIFTNPGFHPAAAYPNIAPLVKVSLLTAPFIAMKSLEDACDRGTFRREFSQYTSAMKDAIRANPAMSRTALNLILEGASLWANVPRRDHLQSTPDLNKTIRGASSEVVVEQLLDAANISYRVSTPEEDIQGVDYFIDTPGKEPLRINIKSNPSQINKFAIPHLPSYITSKTGIIILYPGIRDSLGPEDLRLADQHIDEKSTHLAGMLHEIAAKQTDEMDTLLAELALKFTRL